MKIFSQCMVCFEEQGHPDPTETRLLHIPDNGIIEMRCSKGHEVRQFIQQERFELLSELAVQAIADGYFREAIASFTSALERLYEYYFRVHLRYREVPQEEVNSAWKSLGSSSERQFGAFLAIYIAETRHTPKTLPSKDVELRNNVIHKGRFPSETETILYAQAVVDVAVPLIKQLRSPDYEKARQDHLHDRLSQANADARKMGAAPSTIGLPTLFSLLRSDLGEHLDVRTEVTRRTDWLKVVRRFENPLSKDANILT